RRSASPSPRSSPRAPGCSSPGARARCSAAAPGASRAGAAGACGSNHTEGRLAMLRNWFAGLAAAALVLAVPVSPRAQSLRPPKLDISQFTLPNGLNVVALEDHSAPIVTVQVWYHVGSKDERPGRTGFAHLFEHLMFKGSAHIKPQEH